MFKLIILCLCILLECQCSALNNQHHHSRKPQVAFSSPISHQRQKLTITTDRTRKIQHVSLDLAASNKDSRSVKSLIPDKTSDGGGFAAGIVPFFASIYDKPKEKGTKTVTTRLPIGNLFDSREYIFECATNMRGYEWTVKEAEELLDDLVDASSIGRFGFGSNGKEAEYELNQIVLVPMEWDQGRYGLGQKYDVHDGQQRLVTLCLMLAALRESFRGDDDMAGTVTELASMLNPPKVRKEDILRIQLRKRDNEMLSRILKAEMDVDEVSIGKELRDVKSMSVANRHVLENYGRFLGRVKSFTTEQRVTILDFLCMRVYMLVCVPDTASIARGIVMSQGKGMDNEPIDDFKGLVCFRYTSNEDDMQETFDSWDKLASTPDIESDTVGREIITAACIHRASAVLRSKVGKNDQIFALEGWLREEIKNSEKIDGKSFFSSYIEPASLALGRYRDLNYSEKAFSFSPRARGGEVGNMIAMRLAFLRALTSSVGAVKELEMVILELLLRSTGKGDSGGKKRMTLKQVDQCLHHVERLALWMALLKPTASKRYQRCFEFLDKIDTNENLDANGTYSSITKEEQLAISEELLSFDFGRTPGGRKIATALLQRLNSYSLFRDGDNKNVESMLSGGGGIVQLNVEHVLPVKATKKMWGDDWKNDEDKDLWVHRIGNLALLSKKANTIQKRVDFVSKKERYEKDIWPLTNDITKFDVWNRNSVVVHMGSLLNLVDEVWGL